MNEIEKLIESAITVVRNGGIIIYPTDTAFGIGCRIDDHAAVDRLFDLRKRPHAQATPVLVSSPDMALAYFDHPSDVVRRIQKRYWPGALTIVAPCVEEKVYSLVRGGGKTIGLRMPNHDVPLCIIEAIGVPILGPSANFHGDPTPYSFGDLNDGLMKLVDMVIPGTTGGQGSASTVVDCSVEPYKILRQGAVTLSQAL